MLLKTSLQSYEYTTQGSRALARRVSMQHNSTNHTFALSLTLSLMRRRAFRSSRLWRLLLDPIPPSLRERPTRLRVACLCRCRTLIHR